MNSFKEWFLLNEGFDIPYKVISRIYEYYSDCYKRYIISPKVDFVSFKPFFLDLEGTKYEFLTFGGYYKFYVGAGIVKNYPKEDDAAGQYLGMEKNLTPDGVHITGKIELSLKHFENHGLATLYHEVLHFIQDLIWFRKSHIMDDFVGGLPSPVLVKRIMKEKGIEDVGGELTKPDRRKRDTRINHYMRPVEYYTNLNSLINEIRIGYVKLGQSLSKDLDVWVKDIESKKKYLRDLISNDSYYRLHNVKKFDNELYRIYLQELTKRFVLDDNFLPEIIEFFKNIDKLNSLRKKIQLDKEEAEKKKLVVISAKRKSSDDIAGTKWKKADFSGLMKIDYLNLSDYSNFQDDTDLDWSETVFSRLGMKPDDNEKYSISLTYNNLKKLFDGVRKFRDEEESKAEKCNYDYMGKQLASSISSRLKETAARRGVSEVPSREDIMNIFYPPPYINDCPSEENDDNDSG